MPAYNAEAYIAEAIESVRSQTYDNWELLLVDDRSTDSTCAIAREKQRIDSRIVLLANDRSKGPAGARNVAIERACGRFIAFLDSDDLWHPDKLHRQVDFMLQGHVAFCFSSYSWITSDGKPLGKTIKAPPTLTYDELLHYNYIGCLTVMYDAFALGKVLMPEAGTAEDASLNRGTVRRLGHEDYAMWLSIVKRIQASNDPNMRVSGIADTLAYYRVNPEGISSNKLQAGLFAWDVYRRHERFGLVKSIVYTVRYGLYGLMRRFAD